MHHFPMDKFHTLASEVVPHLQLLVDGILLNVV